MLRCRQGVMKAGERGDDEGRTY